MATKYDWSKVNAILDKTSGKPTPSEASIAVMIVTFQIAEAARVAMMQARVSEWLNRIYENER